MEEYKDVMLSEPPSRFTAAPAVQSMSLENYKGILLCDRPAANKTVQKDSAPPFLPAGKGEERYIGMQPTHEQRTRLELSKSMRQHHTHKTGAVSRHRRWLRSFATAVKQMQLGKVEQQLDSEAAVEKLRVKQNERRKQRLQTVQGNAGAGATQDASATASGIEQQHAADAAVVASRKEETASQEGARQARSGNADAARRETPEYSAPRHSGSKHRGGSKKKSKPKWAMTEDEALDAEMAANQDLVDFAQNLDFDKFIEDYEVKEALAIMKERVQEIAQEQGIDVEDEMYDEDDDEDETSSVATSCITGVSSATTVTRERLVADHKEKKRRAKREQEEGGAASSDPSNVNPKWDNNTQLQDKLRGALNNDALALADKILNASESMRKIHTKHSLAMLLQDVTLDTEVGKRKAMPQFDRHANAGNVPFLAPTQPPVTAVVSAEAQPEAQPKQKRVLTELRNSKSHVQNLPYMYRCPSL